MIKFALNLVLAITISLVSMISNATTYTFTALGSLGGEWSFANAINNTGQVVGYSYIDDRTTHATLWNGSMPTDLGSPLGGVSAAYDINDNGQVVGYSRTARPYTNGIYTEHATLWNGSSASDLGSPSGRNSSAYGINESGQVVGVSGGTWKATLWNGTTTTTLGNSYANEINSSGQVVGSGFISASVLHAKSWNNGITTDLGALVGFSDSNATSINDAGLITGYSYINGSTKSHATLWDGSMMSDLGTLGGESSWAYAINNLGQVVGSSYIMDTLIHATLWSGNNITDINTFLDANSVAAGWILTEATDINDNGWIVGNAINVKTGARNAFLLSVTPVPEPDSYAMILMGLGFIGFLTRRRKNQQA